MNDPVPVQVVRVHFQLPSGVQLPRGAAVRLKIEDVSAADRPSGTIAEEVLDAPLAADPEIRVPADRIDGQSTYSLFVHVDTNRSGSIEAGDLISPEIHPVLTFGAPDEVIVRLILVGRR